MASNSGTSTPKSFDTAIPTDNYQFPSPSEEVSASFGQRASVSGSSRGEERAEIFLYLRQQHRAMKEYVEVARPAKVHEVLSLFKRITEVEKSVNMVSPESREALMSMIAVQKEDGMKLELMIQQFDAKLAQGRQYVEEELISLKDQWPQDLKTWIGKYHWPGYIDCQELQLQQNLVEFIMSPRPIATPVDKEETKAVSEMRDMIMNLQAEIQRLQVKEDNGKKTQPLVTSKTEPAKVSYGEDNTTKEEIRERRRRVRVPNFTAGSTIQARDWLVEYKSICQYVQYSEKETLDDLQIRFKGPALSWYNYLPISTKRNWKLMEKAFMNYFAGGETTVESALNELKHLKQGKMRMVQFGQVLREVARKAEIYSERMLISYLKAAVNMEMTRAIIYRGPETYADAVNICVEVETDLCNGNMDATMKTYNPVYTTTPMDIAEEEVKQNYQETYRKPKYNKQDRNKGAEQRRCFRCKKKGHLKRDCKVRLNDSRQNHQVLKDDYQVESRNQDSDSEEDDVNIFSHLIQNQQDTDKNILKASGLRFKVKIQVNDAYSQGALVDTGSTISSISEATANKLQLQQFACREQVIGYGNKSEQTTAKKAVMDFKFNENEESQAYLYVVAKQNEEVILGMDWMNKEDIVLHAKTCSISKALKHQQNNASLVVKDLLQHFPKLTEESEHQTKSNLPYKHVIDTGEATPVVTRDYRRSPTENEALAEEVKKMLAKKVIVPSNSNWCSPVVLLRKPDNTWRFCVDYRNLNKVTVKDRYPLPLISELLDQLQGFSIFSTLDLKSGFWQLELSEAMDSPKKTAFVANGQLYHFLSMPYGIVNGPSSFSRMMAMVLKGIPRCMCYIDDIIIFSTSSDQHVKDVQRVLERLDSYNLKISEKKCQWFSKEVKFLGFLVSGEGIRSNPEKVQVVKTWTAPTNKKALLRFLGFATFYHKFIKNLSGIAKP